MSESTYYIMHCFRFCLILSNNYVAFLLLNSPNLNQIIQTILQKSWFFLSFINLKKILIFYWMNKKRLIFRQIWYTAIVILQTRNIVKIRWFYFPRAAHHQFEMLKLFFISTGLFWQVMVVLMQKSGHFGFGTTMYVYLVI